MLDITHAIGVEKLDREEREVIHMPEYPLNSFLAALTSLLSACFHLIAAHC